MTFEEAILKIVTSQLNFYFPEQAKITKVNESKKTLEVQLDDSPENVIKNVRWLSKGIPKIGTKCYILFIKNIFNRPVAINIQEFKSFQFKIGDLNELELSDLNFKFKINDIQIEKEANYFLIKNSTGLEMQMDSLNNEFIFKGKSRFTDDCKMEGKLDVAKNIRWNTDTLATSAETHLHGTGVGPSDSPKAGS
jgi:hypothetical protein